MSILRHQRDETVRSARRDIGIVALVSLSAVGLILWRLDLNTVDTAAFADPGWDRHVYREMARRDLFDVRLAPYCWRILVPFLARLLPGALQWGFFSVTFASLVATGPVLFLLVRATGASRAAGLTMVVLFYSLGWAVRYSLSDFWVPDATAMLFTSIAIWMVLTKRWYLAAVTLCVGVLAKESVVFVAPLAYSWHARSRVDVRALRRALIVVFPAVALLIAMRLFVQPENGNADYIATMPPEISRFPELFGEYDYSTRFRDIAIHDRWEHRQWSDIDRYLFDPFGLPLLALVAAGAIADPKRALRASPFVVLVYFQLFFAVDTQRLLVLAFPALAVLGAGGLAFLAERLRFPEKAVIGAAAALLAVSLIDPNVFSVPLLRDCIVFATTLAILAVGTAVFRRTQPPSEPVP